MVDLKKGQRNAVQKVLDSGAAGVSKFLIGTDDKATYDKASGLFVQDPPQVPLNFEFASEAPNTPRLKFEYFVRIKLNPDKDLKPWIESYLGSGTTEVLIPYTKSVTMPSVDIDTDILNQYNRKRVSQTRLQFKPMTLTFHDLVDGKTMRFWEMYYEYYFKDGIDKMQRGGQDTKIRKSQFYDGVLGSRYGNDPHENFGYNLTHVVDGDKEKLRGSRRTATLDAGEIDKGKYLIESIDVHQGRGQIRDLFKKTTVVHPRISSFSHDTLMYSGSTELVELSMTFEYEDLVYSDKEMTQTEYDVYGKVEGKFKELRHNPGGPRTIPGEKGLLSGLFDADLNLPIPADSPILGAAAGAINGVTSNVQQGLKSYTGDLPRQASRAAGDSIFTGEIVNPIDPARAAEGLTQTTVTAGIGGAATSFFSKAKTDTPAYQDTNRVSK